MGYSKAPEQPQNSTRPICHSHTRSSSGREPATIRIAGYRSSPRYALCHGLARSIKVSIAAQKFAGITDCKGSDTT